MSFFDDLPPAVLAEADQAGAQVNELADLMVSSVLLLASLPKEETPPAIEAFLNEVTELPTNLKSAVVFNLALRAAKLK